MKRRSDFIDLTGQRFGRLTVEGIGPRCLYLRSGLRIHHWWHVVCECGWRGTVRGPSLRSGTSKQCVGCRHKASAARNHASSVRLPSGALLVDVAAAAGVSLNTTFVRYQRGWSEAELMLPVNGVLGRRQAKEIA